MKINQFTTIKQGKTELQEICEANQFPTDKYTDHDYVNQYYGYEFANLRDSKVKILEIGICHGGCIDMLKSWMPHSEIHAIDNVDRRAFEYSNTHTYIRDAYCIDALNLFEDSYFDYIIDDADHTIISMAYSIEHWLNKLKVGGTLIIEDIQGGYGWFNSLEDLARKKNVKSYSLYDLTQSKGRNDDFLIVIEK
jgi:hypothetical protein